MKALYLKGDADGLYKLTKNSFRYRQDYFDDFIPNRNKRMADSLELFMNKSSVFCVVGAAHLAGKDGLIDLKRKKNFKVRRVIANYSDTPIEEKAQIKETKDYVFHDTIIGLKAVFPGKPIVTKIAFTHSVSPFMRLCCINISPMIQRKVSQVSTRKRGTSAFDNKAIHKIK